MKEKTRFKNILEFIDSLKLNEEIAGIIEYGGRTFNNMSPGGDYDLSVVFKSLPSNKISGVHFHIADIPVDCMILSLKDFDTEFPDNPFMLAHVGGTILYDRDGELVKIMNHVNTNWNSRGTISENEISFIRFSFKHILDKLVFRLEHDQLYCHYFIGASVDWLLECYAKINDLQVGKAKNHLDYIKVNNLELYLALEAIYQTSDLNIKYKNLEKAFTNILDSYGGLWKLNEVIFHYSTDEVATEEEKDYILNLMLLK